MEWKRKSHSTHTKKRAEKLRTIISIAFISFSAVVSPLILLYLCYSIQLKFSIRWLCSCKCDEKKRKHKSEFCMVRCAREVLVPFKLILAVTFANGSWMRKAYKHRSLNYLRFIAKKTKKIMFRFHQQKNLTELKIFFSKIFEPRKHELH